MYIYIHTHSHINSQSHTFYAHTFPHSHTYTSTLTHIHSHDRWVFLFDKIIVITRRHYRIGAGVRYAVKAYHEVADLVVHPISSLRAKVNNA